MVDFGQDRLKLLATNENWRQLILDFPAGAGLQVDSSGDLEVIGFADLVSGPVSSTDNAVARWDGVTGTLLQDSDLTVSDANVFLAQTDGASITLQGADAGAGLGGEITLQAGQGDIGGDIWLRTGFGLTGGIYGNVRIPEGNLRLGLSQSVILDDDSDTTIQATADDQVVFEVGGTDLFRLDTTGLHSLDASGDIDLDGVGALILDADGDTRIEATTDDRIDIYLLTLNTWRIDTSGMLSLNALADIHMNGNGILSFDADRDSFIEATSNDVISIRTGGSVAFQFSNSLSDMFRDLDLNGNDIINPRWPTREETGNYTVLNTDDFIKVDATGGAITVTLPTAASASGHCFDIKKIDSSANAVTIDGNGAETIDGSATVVLASQYDAVTVRSDGTEWWIT